MRDFICSKGSSEVYIMGGHRQHEIYKSNITSTLVLKRVYSPSLLVDLCAADQAFHLLNTTEATAQR